jgi:hypothetical protein
VDHQRARDARTGASRNVPDAAGACSAVVKLTIMRSGEFRRRLAIAVNENRDRHAADATPTALADELDGLLVPRVRND